jgi:lipopolysaccharide export system ATP-binding protein
MNGLIIEGVHKTHGPTRVIDDLALEAPLGQATILIGQNGAGKSTLFKIIMGLLNADSGRVHFKNKDLLTYPLHEKARLGIGYLPQDAASFAEYSARDNLQFLVELLPISRTEQKLRVDELLETVGLLGLAHRSYSVLSKGEQRRLELAKALCARPTMLLLDEPFSGLDPIIVEELAPLLRSLVERGMGILLTDHNIHTTLALADTVYIIANGQIICSGSADQVTSNQTARTLYFGQGFSL